VSSCALVALLLLLTSKHLLCRHITILYQESYGFERIQDLIKSKDPKRPHKLR